MHRIHLRVKAISSFWLLHRRFVKYLFIRSREPLNFIACYSIKSDFNVYPLWNSDRAECRQLHVKEDLLVREQSCSQVARKTMKPNPNIQDQIHSCKQSGLQNYPSTGYYVLEHWDKISYSWSHPRVDCIRPWFLSLRASQTLPWMTTYQAASLCKFD